MQVNHNKPRFFTSLLISLLSLASLNIFAEEPLQVDNAFPQSIEIQNNEISLKFTMRDYYYLYQHAFKFTGNENISIGEVIFPQAKTKFDEFVGDTQVYDQDLELRIPFTHTNPAVDSVEFTYKFQGCLTDGICYPPTTRNVLLSINGGVNYTGTPVPESERNTSTLINQVLAEAPQNFNNERLATVNNKTQEGTASILDIFGGSDKASSFDEDEILPVEEAFQLSVDIKDSGLLSANWFAQKGYYLYETRLSFSSDNPDIVLGQPLFPKAIIKNDEIFGETPVFYDMANIQLPIIERPTEATRFTLTADYQGCKEDSICYPPSLTTLQIDLPAGNARAASHKSINAQQNNVLTVSEHDGLASKILAGSLWITIASFFAFGIALTFTPCVLPMVPILSGIITGAGRDDKQISTRKALNLSVIYVLAMALVFTIAGVATALLGQNMQAAFQHPVIIILFSLLFVVFALSMFGLFELQMPSSVQTKLSQISNQQESGSYMGAAIMGVLSALIVGPCVTPPLSAALIVIADHGDVFRGGLALFSLAIGMGVPLVIFGTSMGKVLPKAGGWMDHVKNFFGLLMLGLAIWMLARIIPDNITLFLWALLAALTAVFAGAFKNLPSDSSLIAQIFKALGFIAMLYAAMLLIGGVTGAKDPLKPLANLSGGSIEHREIQFKRIKSNTDLMREIQAATANNQKVFLDFYADWCIACKEMEKYTLNEPNVLDAFENWVLLQADVTPNDEIDKNLMQILKVPGPPAMLFFDTTGEEVRSMRLYGFKKPNEFLAHINRLP